MRAVLLLYRSCWFGVCLFVLLYVGVCCVVMCCCDLFCCVLCCDVLFRLVACLRLCLCAFLFGCVLVLMFVRVRDCL